MVLPSSSSESGANNTTMVEERASSQRLDAADSDSDSDSIMKDMFDDDLEEEDGASFEPSLTYAPRAVKRRLVDGSLIDAKQLAAVRRRLFDDDLRRPTMRKFSVEGVVVDMNDPESCKDQQEHFARLFNALHCFSLCRFDEKDPLHRSLSLEAQLTVKRLNKLRENGYKEFDLALPPAVMYVLRSMTDIRYTKPNEIIVQHVPVTCKIDDYVRGRLQVNGLELREVNTSVSLSVNLNMDVKFLFAGQIRVKTTQAQGDKHYVVPTACMGDYMNEAVRDLYDLVYDRTVVYIRSFYKMYPGNTDATVERNSGDVFANMDSHNMYGHPAGNKKAQKEMRDSQTLAYLMRTVGREVNLKKIDLDRNTVFVLTSAVNKKQRYLRAGSALTCTVSSTPVTDDEAVFLSSYVRARIMEDGSLHFQIYSRTCMYLSENSKFPELQSRAAPVSAENKTTATAATTGSSRPPGGD